MSRTIVFLTASPSATSRSTFVARRIAADVERARADLVPAFFSVQDFDAADILQGKATAPSATRFLEHVARADALVLATPVYKASYTGGLKAVVDIIPPDALVGKRALGIVTTKLAPHGAEAASAFRGLFAFFRTGPADALVLLDSELALGDGGGTFAPDAEARVAQSAAALVR